MLDDLIHRRMKTPYTLHVERLRWPKKARATVVLIHGIGSSTLMWQQLAEELAPDVRVIAVDLLGFGKSPHPDWIEYDARTQARSVAKTLLLNRIPRESIIVGHSLGALVAVELARMIPRYGSTLLLVSPPIYKPSRNKIVATQREDVLRGIYKILQRYPKNTERALLLAKRYYIRKTGLSVTPGVNIGSYLMTLESAIINQNTIRHINDVKVPITIISGSRDPLIINKNLQNLNASVPGVRHKMIKRGGHNVVGVLKSGVREEIAAIISRRTAP